MSGSMMKITVDDREAKGTFRRLTEKVQDMTPLMETIGELGVTSIMRNFEKGGRPDRWKPSQRVQKKGGKTLIKSGRLMHSLMHFKAFFNSVTWGTNVPYAAAHQFGCKKSFFVEVREHMRRVKDYGGKARVSRNYRGSHPAHWSAHKRMQHMNLPKRPFLMLQDEDWVMIRAAAQNYLLEAK